MKLEVTALGDYQLIRVEEELKVIADLEELYFLVKGYVDQGKQKIALSFPNASYIYSGAIAILLKCVKTVKENGGEICIIESNPDIKGVLITLGILHHIRLYETEEELVNGK